MIRLGGLVSVCVAALALGMTACAGGPDAAEEPFIITDRAGRDWDVTHAHHVYDMNPAYFNYGLGLGGIASVDEPKVLSAGDRGYPEPDSKTAVFGVDRNSEARAYDVRALTRHEVFNDVYPGESDQYVAVAY